MNQTIQILPDTQTPSPTRQNHDRRKLAQKCNDQPVKNMLAAMAHTMRRQGGTWFEQEKTADRPALVEINLLGVFGSGETGTQACRNWLETANQERGAA